MPPAAGALTRGSNKHGSWHSFVRQFKAMMYRNWLLKYRHPKNFIQELGPAVLAIIVTYFVLRTDEPNLLNADDTMPIYNATYPLSTRNVFIAPDSSPIRRFMNEVFYEMTSDGSSSGNTVGSPSFYSDQNSLLHAWESLLTSNEYTDGTIAIIFEDPLLATPEYTIRFDGKVSSTLQSSTTPGDLNVDTETRNCLKTTGDTQLCPTFDYVKSGIVTLQTFIDMNFIKNHSNSSVLPSPNYQVQSFPWTRRVVLKSGVNYFQIAAPLICSGLTLPAIFIISGLVIEKENRMKESMKMMGLTTMMFWFSWFIMHCMAFFLIILISDILIFLFGIIKALNFFTVLTIMGVYHLSLINLAFIISAFFESAQTAQTVGSLVLFGLLFIGGIPLWYGGEISLGVYWCIAFISPANFVVIVQKLLELDVFENPVWERETNLADFTNIVISGNFTLAWAVGLLFFDSVLYFFLGIYLDMVIPSEGSVRYHPLFFLQLGHYVKLKRNIKRRMEGLFANRDTPSIEEHDVEQVPSNLKMKKLVTTKNVMKHFKVYANGVKQVKKAIDGVTLEFYEDEITAVLGHTGAGKTTLINLLVGHFQPTSGSAHVLDYDITEPADMLEIRKTIGVCPQRDVLADHLTPMEHLKFFAMLRGVYGPGFVQEGQQLLRDVELLSKANSHTKNLSGGQKRKLSMVIALIGNPKVVFLDEPSSGVDIMSQRCMWNVLRKFKKGRSIIMTTQFMDEADVLADRKVILCNGKVKCVGTSMYLKNRFGVGYHLSMTKTPEMNDIEGVTKLIQRRVKGAKLVEDLPQEIDFTLPKKEVGKFPELFEILENDTVKQQYGITDYGISMTTLEEVFLTLNEYGVADQLFPETLKQEESHDSTTVQSGVNLKEVQKKPAEIIWARKRVSLSYYDRVSLASVETSAKPPSLVGADVAGVDTSGNKPPSNHGVDNSVFDGISINDGDSDLSGWAGSQSTLNPSRSDLNFDGTQRQDQFEMQNRGEINMVTPIDQELNRETTHIDRSTPVKNFFTKLFGLIKIRFFILVRQPTTFVFQVILPIIITTIAFLVLYFTTLDSTIRNVNLLAYIQSNKFDLQHQPLVIYNNSFGATGFQDLKASLEEILGDSTVEISSANFSNILHTQETHLLGVRVENVDISNANYSNKWQILYNISVVHVIPAAVNLLSSVMYKDITGSDTPITTNILPLPPKFADENFVRFYSSQVLLGLLVMSFGLGFIPGGFGIEAVKERQLCITKQLRIGGCSFYVYWLSFYVVHVAFYMISVVVMIILIYALNMEFFTPTPMMVCFMLLIVGNVHTVTLTMYCFSTFFEKYDKAQTVLPLIAGFGQSVLLLMLLLLGSQDSSRIKLAVHVISGLIYPGYNFYGGIYYAAQASQRRRVLRVNPVTFQDVFDNDEVIASLIITGVYSVLLPVILILLDSRKNGLAVWQTLGIKKETKVIPPQLMNLDSIDNEDNDVYSERIRVESWNPNDKTQEKPVVACRKLRKEFNRDDIGLFACCENPKDQVKVVVENTSLGVKPGEILGLLGPNGAGKTTTISMLLWLERPTEGQIFVNGTDPASHMAEAYRSTGYCPQFDALWDEITVYETLSVYAIFQEIKQDYRDAIIDKYLTDLQIAEEKHKRTKDLSGGDKRKISYTLAMLGDPQVVMLDEPSTGMDPKSKRFLWDNILKDFLGTKRGAILTTHSMEEADALCARVAIMVGGRLKCIGSTQHLKSKYGSGYQLDIKVPLNAIEKEQPHVEMESRLSGAYGSLNSSLHSPGEEMLDKIHIKILELFPRAVVKERMFDRIAFQVPQDEVGKLSKAFTEMEKLKHEFGIEEYNLSQTTLEQVFLQFAKVQAPVRTSQPFQPLLECDMASSAEVINGSYRKFH